MKQIENNQEKSIKYLIDNELDNLDQDQVADLLERLLETQELGGRYNDITRAGKVSFTFNKAEPIPYVKIVTRPDEPGLKVTEVPTWDSEVSMEDLFKLLSDFGSKVYDLHVAYQGIRFNDQIQPRFGKDMKLVLEDCRGKLKLNGGISDLHIIDCEFE